MRYTIAGIPIFLPETLLAGHFAQALKPFAGPQDTQTPFPTGDTPKGGGGSATFPESGILPPRALEGLAAQSVLRTIDGLSAQSAGISAHLATDGTAAGPDTPCGTGTLSDFPESAGIYARDGLKASPCAGSGSETASLLPEILLRQDICPPAQPDYCLLDAFDFADADADCRFGLDAEGYLLEMAPRSGAAPARFRKRFDNPVVTTDFTLSHHPALLRFGLWTAFNLAAVRHRSAAFHSSVIRYQREGVLFLGESGTGKSTHTRLWREHIPGAVLLNDDSPIVRLPDDGTARVCGSPWSGKTPCYRNEELPIAGIVRLSQAPHNRIRRLRPLEALGALLPSAPPAFARDERLQDLLCEIVSELVKRVPVYHLECLPDADAARLTRDTIFGI